MITAKKIVFKNKKNKKKIDVNNIFFKYSLTCKMSDEHLANLITWRDQAIQGLLHAENELAEKKKAFHDGNNLREQLGYTLADDLGNEAPCGVKYLHVLENEIYYYLPNKIYATNQNIERLTSQIEELEPMAVPAPEAVEEA